MIWFVYCANKIYDGCNGLSEWSSHERIEKRIFSAWKFQIEKFVGCNMFPVEVDTLLYIWNKCQLKMLSGFSLLVTQLATLSCFAVVIADASYCFSLFLQFVHIWLLVKMFICWARVPNVRVSKTTSAVCFVFVILVCGAGVLEWLQRICICLDDMEKIT